SRPRHRKPRSSADNLSSPSSNRSAAIHRVCGNRERSLTMSAFGRVPSWILTLAVLGPVFVASPSGAAERPKVVATTVQIAGLTAAVDGDRIELKGIIPAGVDPHEFEPTASDLVAIEGAALVLRHGIGLDDWLDRTLQAGKRATIVTVTRGVRIQK